MGEGRRRAWACPWPLRSLEVSQRGAGHVGSELIRLGTPAGLLLGPLRSVADVLGPGSSRPHFPHMASYSTWKKSDLETNDFSMKHIIPFSHELFPFLSLLFLLSLFSACSLSVAFPRPLSRSSLYFCVVFTPLGSLCPSLPYFLLCYF